MPDRRSASRHTKGTSLPPPPPEPAAATDRVEGPSRLLAQHFSVPLFRCLATNSRARLREAGRPE